MSVSIILPAKNEAESLEKLLPALRSEYPDAELIVVDDGSSDGTAQTVERHGAKCIRHPYSIGNGGAIKSGARAASGKILVFMDADGQHRPQDVERLLNTLNEGYDMAVGARDRHGHASTHRRLANWIYNFLASRIVGHRIQDLTSGMRAVRADKFARVIDLLPNGFSYPTTSTMAFFRLGFRVGYTGISVQQRHGTSHIRLLQDGFRFLLIIIKVSTLYSPLKLFVPVSAGTFVAATLYYLYTYLSFGRFTNMSTLLYMVSMIVFLFGLLSEQVTTLMYSQTSDHSDKK